MGKCESRRTRNSVQRVMKWWVAWKVFVEAEEWLVVVANVVPTKFNCVGTTKNEPSAGQKAQTRAHWNQWRKYCIVCTIQFTKLSFIFNLPFVHSLECYCFGGHLPAFAGTSQRTIETSRIIVGVEPFGYLTCSISLFSLCRTNSFIHAQAGRFDCLYTLPTNLRWVQIFLLYFPSNQWLRTYSLSLCLLYVPFACAARLNADGVHGTVQATAFGK